MAYQCGNFIKLLFTLIFIISKIVLTTQQNSCTLPGGKGQSTSMRLHLCESFQSVIRQYGGRPPSDVAQNIRSHACPNSGFICCPDNAVAQTTTTTTASPIPPPPSDLTFQVDYNAFRNHRNYNLVNDRRCGISTAKRIVGGENAALKEFPWAALLGYELLDSMRWQCGGTLISSQFVLTAAHCLNRELAMVRLGEHQISTESDCDEFNVCAEAVQDIKISIKTRHPKYRSKPSMNDIALLKLVSPADTSKNNVKTICLPNSNLNDINKLINKNLVITGWGKVENGEASDILQKAFVPYLQNNDCSRIFKPYNLEVYTTYLCAGGHNKTDTCKGDSGGGIAAHGPVDDRPKMILYGVVSGGIECLNQDKIFPGIYTDVRYYLLWILNNMS